MDKTLQTYDWKKYELLKDDYIEISGVKLYRIRALVDFNDVKME